ncbi:hypothetical protein BaRGS_00036542, partial [Batillaria attramentaria]
MRVIILLLLVALATAQMAQEELTDRELVERELAALSQERELRNIDLNDLARRLCRLLNGASKIACTVACRRFFPFASRYCGTLCN